MCDGCDFWHHAKCVDMPATEYVRLSDSPEYWHCRPCTLPPFSDLFFNSTTSTLGLDLMTESFDMSDGTNTANDSAPDTELTSNTSDGDDEVRLFPELRQLQDQFRKNFKLGHLNINSIRNKFGPISELHQVELPSSGACILIRISSCLILNVTVVMLNLISGLTLLS